ncbi:MAG TPA: NADP-dependent oxidoreductase [Alphaproteobacteria bacterium]|jgi:NADPH:quinone reductase-like Zn-dependent oxidoreductase|nr:NADP-dependent oxidoreductase [Alphaproteobacteria bacterium]
MSSLVLDRPAQAAHKARTMKAWRVNGFGGAEAMTLEDIAVPPPGAGEILVKVAAAGVGPWDGWIRSGHSALPQPLPLTLGSDLSGTVAALGEGVTDFAEGEAVYGVTNPRFIGAYAEYAVAKAGMIAGKPESLSHDEAASVPVIAVTAWQALFEQARVGQGQTVLIHGAAGNVGAYAVQFARQSGARVIATAATGDIETVRALGADRVIDYRTQRFEDDIRGIDVVVDLVGGETQVRSFAVLKPGGMLVSAVSEPDQALAARHGVKALFFLVEVTTLHLTRIAEMIDAGELRVNVGQVLALAEAKGAHEMLEGIRPHPRGKIVLSVAA